MYQEKFKTEDSTALSLALFLFLKTSHEVTVLSTLRLFLPWKEWWLFKYGVPRNSRKIEKKIVSELQWEWYPDMGERARESSLSLLIKMKPCGFSWPVGIEPSGNNVAALVRASYFFLPFLFYFIFFFAFLITDFVRTMPAANEHPDSNDEARENAMKDKFTMDKSSHSTYDLPYIFSPWFFEPTKKATKEHLSWNFRVETLGWLVFEIVTIIWKLFVFLCISKSANSPWRRVRCKKKF